MQNTIRPARPTAPEGVTSFLSRNPDLWNESVRLFDSLPGSVQPQTVLSGKNRRVYFYYFTRERGRLLKRYVRPSELADMRAFCHAHAQRKAVEAQRRQNFRDVNAILRRLRHEFTEMRRASQ